jgi:hypothetical protein
MDSVIHRAPLSIPPMEIIAETVLKGNRRINEKHIPEKSRHDKNCKRVEKMLKNYKNKI